MKLCTFKVARAIKEAGYPQSSKPIKSYDIHGVLGAEGSNYKRGKHWDAPTYLEVWLWLWREKKIKITPIDNFATYIQGFEDEIQLEGVEDPEEAIIGAIEYLVDNNLIK